MKPILDFFGSLRLTLGLLLLLAFVSVLGTFKPAMPGRFELFYQTIWFRFLLALLALNLVVCTIRTIQKALGADRRLAASLEALAPSADAPKLPDPIDIQDLAARCRSQGYRIKRIQDRLLLTSRHWCRWSIPILHISILLIMCGAFMAELGFVGTMNIYVGHQSDRYFDWDVERELPIGFTLRLDHFEPEYYPIDLRFATIDRATQDAIQVYTTREGETVALGDGVSVVVTRFFPEEEHLVLTILRDGIPQGQYHALSGQRNYPNSIRLNYEIRPVAFRDPLLKQLYSQVSILEQGQEVKQGTIAVNQPLVHRGVAIYQTTFNRDESGFWTCGFQLSKDPGEPLVWFGSIVLSLTLLWVFALRPKAAGMVPTARGWQLSGLIGFRGQMGQTRLNELLKQLEIRPGD